MEALAMDGGERVRPTEEIRRRAEITVAAWRTAMRLRDLAPVGSVERVEYEHEIARLQAQYRELVDAPS